MTQQEFCDIFVRVVEATKGDRSATDPAVYEDCRAALEGAFPEDERRSVVSVREVAMHALDVFCGRTA